MSTPAYSLKSLINKDLSGFRIEVWVEVYGCDSGGARSSAVGFFRDIKTAKAYIKTNPDPAFHGTDQALILTDGAIGFKLQDGESVKLFDEKEELQKIKAAIEKKLSPEELAIIKEV